VGRLKRPHGFSNPGGFDYERWLFQQGIRATGYIRKDSRNRLLTGGGSAYFSGLRSSLVLTLREAPQQSPGMALIRALTVGDRNGVTSEQWAVLRSSGTSHLMAISGLHISLAAGFGFLLVRRLWSCSSRLTEKVAAVRAAAIAAIICAIFYAYLAGFSIPTQRALIMVTIFMLATLWGSRSVLANTLCLAVFAVLIIDPLSVLSAGWWLSFWAVAVIAFTVTGREGKQSLWWKWGRVHLLMALGMLPMLLSFFQSASLISPLANVVAVPFVGLLVVPVSLIGVCLLAVSESVGLVVLELAAGMMDALWPFLDALAASRMASWEQHQPPGWTLLPAIIGILLLFSPRGIPAGWLGLILLLPLFTVQPARPGPGEFWLTLLDVGQGLATVIQTQHHTLVYDAGAKFSDSFNAGEAVLVPFLRHQGVDRLDMLIISHTDNDHIGGVASLVKAWFPIDVLSGLPGKSAEKLEEVDEFPAPRQCQSGQRWEWDGVEFEVLHPQPGMSLKGNNASCVLVIRTVDGQSAMLTGDIEAVAEQHLLRHYSGRLSADVLVAPHHGSKTSSTRGFLSAVSPDHVLFPAGYRNRYGFPKPAVVDRYRSLGTATHVTGHQGAVLVKFIPGEELAIDTHRRQYRRYWRLK